MDYNLEISKIVENEWQLQGYKANRVIEAIKNNMDLLPDNLKGKYLSQLKNTKLIFHKTKTFAHNDNEYKAFASIASDKEGNPITQIELGNIDFSDFSDFLTLTHELGHIACTRKRVWDDYCADLGELQLLYQKEGRLQVAGNMINEVMREILTYISVFQNSKDIDLSTLNIEEENISPIYSPFLKTTQLLLFALNNTKNNIVNVQHWDDNQILNALFCDSRLLKTAIESTDISYFDLMQSMDKYCSSEQSEISLEDMNTIKKNIDQIFRININNSNISEQERKERIAKYKTISQEWVNDCNKRAKHNMEERTL